MRSCLKETSRKRSSCTRSLLERRAREATQQEELAAEEERLLTEGEVLIEVIEEARGSDTER